MAIILPSTAVLPRTINLGLTAFSRAAIEQQIETLVEPLDQIDGDTDVEDDELGGEPLDFGEAKNHADILPRYGIDQRLRPTNEREAIVAHELSRAMGGRHD